MPFPSPRDLPGPGVKPVPTALRGGFFTTEPPGKTQNKEIPLTERKKKKVFLPSRLKDFLTVEINEEEVSGLVDISLNNCNI